jgi:hypothetical protein
LTIEGNGRYKRAALSLAAEPCTWLGVYETTDGGGSWHLYGSGLPMVVVSDLYMPTDGSYLRVCIYGRGVWEIRF